MAVQVPRIHLDAAPDGIDALQSQWEADESLRSLKDRSLHEALSCGPLKTIVQISVTASEGGAIHAT